MSIAKYIFFTGLSLFHLKSPLLAQGKTLQDSLYFQALSNTVVSYSSNMGAESLRFNGTTYTNYWHGVNGHPFFESENFKSGNIQYLAVGYQGIPLLYDIEKDLVVSTKYASPEPMALPGDKIRSFSIGQHQFERLDADNYANIKTGFYEILYRGSMNAYVKHKKEIKQSFKTEDRTSTFYQYDEYYIEKNGRFHVINAGSDIVALFTEHQQEIRKKLKERDINFKKNPEKCLIQIANFYDTLIK
jgi:hypothetical protein